MNDSAVRSWPCGGADSTQTANGPASTVAVSSPGRETDERPSQSGVHGRARCSWWRRSRAQSPITNKEASMRRLELFGSGKSLLLLFLCSVAPVQAHAEVFDGAWSVLEVCESSPEGARGYKWTYPATVRDGYFVGQYRQEGQSPSMSLKGRIKPDGSASLIAHGISGDFGPQHKICASSNTYQL